MYIAQVIMNTLSNWDVGSPVSQSSPTRIAVQSIFCWSPYLQDFYEMVINRPDLPEWCEARGILSVSCSWALLYRSFDKVRSDGNCHHGGSLINALYSTAPPPPYSTTIAVLHI